MSFGTVKVVEPRVAISADQSKNHVVLSGGLRVTETSLTADSWGSPNAPPSSQITFNIFPPSTTTMVDRYFKLRLYIRVITDQAMQLGLNDALRCMPFSALIDVLTVQINGESISDNVADHLYPMRFYGVPIEANQLSPSVSPSYPDMYQEYSHWNLPPPNGGSAKNCLAGYGENQFDTRGGFPVVEAEDQKSFTTIITEGIYMSPFLCGYGSQEEAMVNVNQISLNFRLKTDYQRILSHSTAGNAITNVQLQFTQAPEVLVTFITPDLRMQIPPVQILPYYKPLDFVKNIGDVAPGASVNVIGDSIKLSQIPRRMYLWCKISRNDESFETADNFLRLDSISLLWANQNGLFASARPTDLYEISRRNGMERSWPQWSKFTGSVFCAEFGKDIGLLDSEAPGVQGQYNLQVQATFTNTGTNTYEYQFFQMFLLEGTFSISENQARATLGNLTNAAVLAAKQVPVEQALSYNQYEGLQGGNFFTSLKGFLNKLSTGVSQALPAVAPVLASAFPGLAPALPVIGAVSEATRALTGQGRSGRRSRRLR